MLSASISLAADPICGDVNDTSTITASDALLVLKKSVSQPVDLDCSAFDDQFAACEASLAGRNADLAACNTSLLAKNAELAACLSAPVCGNGVVEEGEDCDVGSLNSDDCVSQGFAGGTLDCSPGCIFDTSDCYAQRFDASGNTILDHETGLEWEKKTTTVSSGENLNDPHDVDNTYAWSSTGTAPDGDAFTDFLARLNGGGSQDGLTTTGCYAGHCDWRLPTVEELLGIGAIGPAFQPDADDTYWSATTNAVTKTTAWYVDTDDGSSQSSSKMTARFVRAVRSGL